MERSDCSDRLVGELRSQPKKLADKFLGKRVARIRTHLGIRHQLQNFTRKFENHRHAP